MNAETTPNSFNTDHNPEFSCHAIFLPAGDFAGMITSWHFGGFRYIEHFAICPSMRNSGLGAKALSEFMAMDSSPIVLEVELPEDELSRRRIGFYERQGMELFDCMEYVQPPYRPTGNSLPMHLMASTGFLNPANFEEVRDKLHSHVYGLKKQ